MRNIDHVPGSGTGAPTLANSVTRPGSMLPSSVPMVRSVELDMSCWKVAEKPPDCVNPDTSTCISRFETAGSYTKPAPARVRRAGDGPPSENTPKSESKSPRFSANVWLSPPMGLELCQKVTW
jgi:hypothetical protein